MITRVVVSVMGALALLAKPVFAATPEGGAAPLFQTTPKGDWAGSWITFLFRGEGGRAPNADALTSLAEALRGALSVYGVAMLTIAGFLLLWQVISMVAETAQTGVPMGRRTNQLWVPMRFLVGIILLIPVGGGLSIGQHMIVKLAVHGSSLASDAWRGALDIAGDKLQAPIVPHNPDTGRIVATSMETELCRSLYHQLFNAAHADPVVMLAGDMIDVAKIPAGRLTDESWRYTNTFFPDAALCGEYRFVSVIPTEGFNKSGAEQSIKAIGESSRLAAQRLSLQSKSLADRVSSAFLSTDAQTPAPADMQTSLSSIVKEQNQFVEATLRQLALDQKKNSTSSLGGARGWVAAGSFPFDMARRQIALGEAASYALPDVKSPLPGHLALTYDEWMKAGAQQSTLHGLPVAQFDRYAFMYDRLTVAMKKARAWLYDRQVPDALSVLPDQQDVRDVLNDYADSAVAQTAFARLMTSGAVAYGVFARTAQGDGTASYSSATASVLPDRAYIVQPLQTLAEVGRRFMNYGSWLMGMLSPALAQPATLGIGLCLSVVALLFWGAGAGLLFVVPFIPLFRFLVAVMAWGLAVLMAVVSLPIVALGHLYPAGDGLVGPLARRAYWLWLGLFMRPCLILFAFAGGLILFLMGVGLLNALFFEWMAPMALVQSPAFWIFRSAVALLYAISVFVLANVAFRGLASFPSSILSWIEARSIMPESLVMAGGFASGQSTAVMQVLGGPNGGAASVAVSSAVSGVQGGAERSTSHERGEKKTDVATRQAQSAHFPHVSEERISDRTDVRAEAHAQAFAKAEGSDGGKSEALSSASASSDAATAKALAMSRHMLPADKEERGAGTYRKNELDKVAPQPTIEQAKKPSGPSVEQTGAPLADAQNPFKTGAGPEKKD